MAATAEQINNLRGMGRQEEQPKVVDAAPMHNLVKAKVHESRPDLTDMQTEEVAGYMLSRKNGGVINVGGKEIDTVEMSFSIADCFDFWKAESIQSINSETDPQQEYFRWIDEGIKVINEMTDGNITDHDMDHRESFLTNLDQREIEMRTCIALYQHSATFGNPKMRELAQDKIDRLQVRWAKMLEIRSCIKNSTKERAAALREREVSEQERDNAKLYLMALYYMRRDQEIPLRMKAKLGLMIGVVFDYSVSEEFIKSINKDNGSKSDVMERINALRGRQDPTYRPKLLVERQNFNSANFYELKKMQELRQRV